MKTNRGERRGERGEGRTKWKAEGGRRSSQCGRRRRKADGEQRALSPLPSPLSPASSRRGVLLLLILALLAMFGLIAVAFVVISGQAQRSAKSIERIGLTDDPARVPARCFSRRRCKSSAAAPTRPPSWGRIACWKICMGMNTCTGTVASAAHCPPAFQPIGEHHAGRHGGLTRTLRRRPAMTLVDQPPSISPSWPGDVGCVLTITTVPLGSTTATSALVGQSTRIVAATPALQRVQVMAFPNGTVPPQGEHVHDQRRAVQRHGLWIQPESRANST